jgi:5-enolpyruvylshikimate-3-phosphate synthase
MQQMQLQVSMAKEQATAAALNAQAAEAQARAEKYKAETIYTAYDSETNRIKAVSTNLNDGTEDDKEFERRFRIAELMLKEKQMDKGEQQNANPNGNEENSGSNQRGFQQIGEASGGFGGIPQ